MIQNRSPHFPPDLVFIQRTKKSPPKIQEQSKIRVVLVFLFIREKAIVTCEEVFVDDKSSIRL